MLRILWCRGWLCLVPLHFFSTFSHHQISGDLKKVNDQVISSHLMISDVEIRRQCRLTRLKDSTCRGPTNLGICRLDGEMSFGEVKDDLALQAVSEHVFCL